MASVATRSSSSRRTGRPPRASASAWASSRSIRAIRWLCPPAYVRDVALPALERGRKRAGKTLSGFEVVAAVPLAVTGDVAGARAALRVELARYLALPFYRAMLEASGLGPDVRAFDRDGEVPETLADALGTVGDAAAACAYVAAYRDAGV